MTQSKNKQGLPVYDRGAIFREAWAMFKSQPSCIPQDPFSGYLKAAWAKARETRVIKIQKITKESAMAVEVLVNAVTECGRRYPMTVWVPKSAIYPDWTVEKSFWARKTQQVSKQRVPAYFLTPIAAV